MKIDLSVGSVHLHLRAAKAVWLRWDIGKIYVTRQEFEKNIRFGVKVAPQLVGAYTSSRKSKIRDASTIRLPSLTAVGNHRCVGDQPILSAAINLGFFVGILKPAVLDRLLSLHQRLGSDIVTSMQEYRDSSFNPQPVQHEQTATFVPIGAPSAKTSIAHEVLFDLRLSVEGVRFGLKADDVATTLLFEAFSLKGHASNQVTKGSILWRAKVEHFGLSLGHLGTTDLPDEAQPIRRHRSAYMVFDIDVQEIPGTTGTSASQLNISLNRVHTVMHIAALSELVDLVRSWQSDVHILRDNRAAEMAEVKVHTSKILKQLEVSEKGDQPEASWFATRLFTIEVTGLGIAIPLDEAAAIDLQQRNSSVTPALLFSIRMISFQNRRNETARFRVQQTALQFLDK